MRQVQCDSVQSGLEFAHRQTLARIRAGRSCWAASTGASIVSANTSSAVSDDTRQHCQSGAVRVLDGCSTETPLAPVENSIAMSLVDVSESTVTRLKLHAHRLVQALLSCLWVYSPGQ